MTGFNQGLSSQCISSSSARLSGFIRAYGVSRHILYIYIFPIELKPVHVICVLSVFFMIRSLYFIFTSRTACPTDLVLLN